MVAPAQDSAQASTAVIISFDGCCEPRNPGGDACGGWDAPAQAGQQGSEGVRGQRCDGSGAGMTNNVAEYNAALDALRALYGAGYRGPVELRGDSKLVVEQCSGRWCCNAPALQERLHQLRHAASHVASVQMAWIPRERNAEADSLARTADLAERGR